MKNLLSLLLLSGFILSLSACGQKGPLIVDKPVTEQAETQEKELEETK